MAASADQLLEARCPEGRIPIKAAASKTLYANTLVFGASGYGTDVTNSGANAFLGVAVDKIDNGSGSAGDVSGEAYTEGVFYLSGTSFTQGTVGSAIYASDNNTVTATSSSNSKIGRCVDFVSATKIGVKIDVVQA